MNFDQHCYGSFRNVFLIPLISPSPPDISLSVYKPTQNPLRSGISLGLISGSLRYRKTFGVGFHASVHVQCMTWHDIANFVNCVRSMDAQKKIVQISLEPPKSHGLTFGN